MIRPIAEQELLVGLLKNDPRVLAHYWANSLMFWQDIEKNDQTLHHRADEFIRCALEFFKDDKESIARILRTWLTIYDIRLDPQKIPAFEELHACIGTFVLQKHKNILPYD